MFSCFPREISHRVSKNLSCRYSETTDGGEAARADSDKICTSGGQHVSAFGALPVSGTTSSSSTTYNVMGLTSSLYHF